MLAKGARRPPHRSSPLTGRYKPRDGRITRKWSATPTTKAALWWGRILGAVPLSREGSFNVPSAHQPGRKDAPWKLKVNGVTTPLAPTAARLTRTTSTCTATLKDAFA